MNTANFYPPGFEGLLSLQSFEESWEAVNLSKQPHQQPRDPSQQSSATKHPCEDLENNASILNTFTQQYLQKSTANDYSNNRQSKTIMPSRNFFSPRSHSKESNQVIKTQNVSPNKLQVCSISSQKANIAHLREPFLEIAVAKTENNLEESGHKLKPCPTIQRVFEISVLGTEENEEKYEKKIIEENNTETESNFRKNSRTRAITVRNPQLLTRSHSSNSSKYGSCFSSKFLRVTSAQKQGDTLSKYVKEMNLKIVRTPSGLINKGIKVTSLQKERNKGQKMKLKPTIHVNNAKKGKHDAKKDTGGQHNSVKARKICLTNVANFYTRNRIGSRA